MAVHFRDFIQLPSWSDEESEGNRNQMNLPKSHTYSVTTEENQAENPGFLKVTMSSNLLRVSIISDFLDKIYHSELAADGMMP